MKKICFVILFFFPFVAQAGRIGNVICVTGALINGECVPKNENQSQPHIAFDSINDRYLVVWTDQREKNTKGTDIYARLFEARGENITKLSDDIAVASIQGDQMEPKVAFDPENQRYLVVWTDTGSGVGRIYGQFLDRDGNLIGKTFQISQSNFQGLSNFYAQSSPDLVYNTLQRTFQVVWLDITDLEHNYFEWDSLCGVDVYYQFINSPYADDIVVRLRKVNFEDSQDNDLDGDGSPLDSSVTDHSAYVVSDYQRNETCEATSQKLEITYKFLTMNEETTPKISYSTITGEPFVVWSGKSSKITYKVTFERKRSSENDPWGAITVKELYEEDRDSNISIFGRLFMPTITKDLTFSDTSKNSYNPSVTFDPQRKMWFVVFETENKIYGQLSMMENNVPYGSRIQISATDVTGPLSRPNVSFDPVNQRYIVVWEDARNQSSNISNIDVYGQFIDPQGNLSGANFPITVASGNQLDPTLCFGDFDFSNFLVLWKDGSNPANAEIYGQLWAYSVAPQILLTNEDGTPIYTSILGFGNVEVSSSANKTFKIWNFGNQTLIIENVSAPSSPFSIETPLPTNIAPGSYYSMQVKFAPTVVGSYAYSEGNNFKISIKSNGGNLDLYLSGIATKASSTDGGPTPGGGTGGGTIPEETEKKTGGGAKGCFIAEAAFGSYLHPHVAVLRAFRDKYLLGNSMGKTFVEFYYKHSPSVADVIRKHETLKMLLRIFLTPLVWSIKYPMPFFFSLGIGCFFLIKRQFLKKKWIKEIGD